MTVQYTGLDTIRGEAAYFKSIIERTLQIIAASKDSLAVSVPDTFLGRKTQEPFPKEPRIIVGER